MFKSIRTDGTTIIGTTSLLLLTSDANAHTTLGSLVVVGGVQFGALILAVLIAARGSRSIIALIGFLVWGLCFYFVQMELGWVGFIAFIILPYILLVSMVIMLNKRIK